MVGYIDGVDFINIECEKYWSYSTSYKGNRQKEMTDMILGGNYIGSEKKDGIYERFIKDEDGNCFLIARNQNVDGGMTNKIGHVPQLKDFFNSLPNGTCFLGELYFHNNPGSRRVITVMGCLEDKAIQRQESGEKLSYYIFDVWAANGKSLLKTTIEDRIDILSSFKSQFNKNPYVEYAQYYIGEELENELARVRSSGGEGIVITKLGTIPGPGKRTARKTLKIKTELDSPVDCFLTGRWKPATRLYSGKMIEEWMYWENIKTNELLYGKYYQDYFDGGTVEPVTKAYYNGWGSAIELGMVDKDGNEIPVAWISGIGDEVKEGIVNNPERWKHRVVMVNAMGIENDTHKFRHGRIVSWRDDKSWKDCEIEQLWKS